MTVPELRLEDHIEDPAAPAAYAQLEALRIASVFSLARPDAVSKYVRERLEGLFKSADSLDGDFIAALACLGFLEEYLKPLAAVFGEEDRSVQELDTIADTIFADVESLARDADENSLGMHPATIRRKILAFAAVAMALLETQTNRANAEKLAYLLGGKDGGIRKPS